MVEGLPTLLVFRRAQAQLESIRRVAEDNRRATMATLRLSFLSSAVLEFVATIAVALVAVSTGLRLVSGGLDLRTAVVVLVLAPEAYWPLRQVGAQFHSSAEGVAAAEQVFAVLDTPARRRGPDRAPRRDLARAVIRVEHAHRHLRPTAASPGPPRTSSSSPASTSGSPGPADPASRPCSGSCSASSYRHPARVLVQYEGGDGAELSSFDRDDWRSLISWVPQQPWLAAASILDNVRIARPGRARLGRDSWLSSWPMPPGSSRPCPQGRRPSSGSGRRPVRRSTAAVALARAFLRDSPLVLLDEPTAHLDADSEAGGGGRGQTAGGGSDRDRGRAPAGCARRRGPRRPAGSGCGPRHSCRHRGGGVMTQIAHPDGRPPARPWRLLAPSRAAAGRLSLATVSGAAALVASIGLTATAAWLIARASQHPPVLELTVAVVAVRFFGVTRPVLRYVERLISHDAALRLQGDLRSTVYARLVPLTSSRLRWKRGDLLTGVVTDIDAVEDLYLRILEPAAVAALVCATCVAAALWVLPSLALVLAVAFLVAGLAAPLAAAAASRRADGSAGPQARGTLRRSTRADGRSTRPDRDGCGDRADGPDRAAGRGADERGPTVGVGGRTGFGPGIACRGRGSVGGGGRGLVRRT